jgi:hypothetical protein
MREINVWTVFTRDEITGLWMWALIGRDTRYVYGVGAEQDADVAAENARTLLEEIGGRDGLGQ